MKKITLLIIVLTYCFGINAQSLPNKVAGKKNQAYADSIKNSEYTDFFPIGGKKATKAGYDLPYSAGVSVNYFWQQSDLVIDNLNIGFNHGTKQNIDNLVKFDKAKATASAVTVRPDFYLFPFLDVYGIFGVAAASTDIGVGIYVPDSAGNDRHVSTINTKIEFQAKTFGVGMLPTFGIGNYFLAIDMNIAWTDVPQLKQPAVSTIFAPRLGKRFSFKNRDMKLVTWVGAFRVNLNSKTEGSIALSEVLPPGELAPKLTAAEAQVVQSQQENDAWWSNLTPVEQKNPVNAARYDRTNQALATAGQAIDGLQTASTKVSDGSVQYEMEKRPKDKWNFIVGTQFQINKHWMVRGEYGFLGSRTQGMLGVQYRFGL